jgi:hypothetical protein
MSESTPIETVASYQIFNDLLKNVNGCECACGIAGVVSNVDESQFKKNVVRTINIKLKMNEMEALFTDHNETFNHHYGKALIGAAAQSDPKFTVKLYNEFVNAVTEVEDWDTISDSKKILLLQEVNGILDDIFKPSYQSSSVSLSELSVLLDIIPELDDHKCVVFNYNYWLDTFNVGVTIELKFILHVHNIYHWKAKQNNLDESTVLSMDFTGGANLGH